MSGLHRHLSLDTQTIHAGRWPRVPGARWLNYARPADAFSKVRPAEPARPKTATAPRPTVARFLLDGPVLPTVFDTVRVAELFRHAALCRLGRGARSEVLSGKDADGQPLRSHDHAHFLPTAEGPDRHRLTHLTVVAAAGLGPAEVAALAAVRTFPLPVGGDRELALRVQMLGLGDVPMFQDRVRLFGPATEWVSATPFVVHRHLKRRGTKRDTPHLTGPDPRADFALLALRELVEKRLPGRSMRVEPEPALVCGDPDYRPQGLRTWQGKSNRSRHWSAAIRAGCSCVPGRAATTTARADRSARSA